MTERDELKRFADGGGGPELSASIALARAEGPNAEQRARLRAKLGLPVEAPSSHSDSANANAAAPAGEARVASAWIGKVGISTAILVLAGAAFWMWLEREPATHALLEPRQRPAEPAPAPAPPAVISPSEPERSAKAQLPTRPRPETAPRRDVKKAPAPAQAEPEIDAAAELALLRRARSHVRSAPSRALALVAEHEERFASGALIEEREVIAIEALLLSGASDKAEARAAAFVARYPQSAHVRRVRVLLSEQGASDQGSTVPATPSR